MGTARISKCSDLGSVFFGSICAPMKCNPIEGKRSNNDITLSPPPPSVGPFQASLRIYLRQGNEFIQKVRTDSQGKFFLRLAPGEYRIVPDIMQDNHAVGPGGAEGLIIVGRYEAAPALNIRLKRSHPLAVTITYQMLMGS